MEIRYTIEEQDLKCLIRYCRLNRRPEQLSMAFAIVAAITIALYGSPTFHLSRPVYATINIVLSPLLFIYFYQVVMLYRLHRHRGVLGDGAMSIMPEGIHERTAVNDDFVYWKAVHDVARTHHAIYLLLGADSRGYLVPSRSFADRAEAERFYSLARGYWQSAKAGWPVGPPPDDQ
jgi:YcxB-like protein